LQLQLQFPKLAYFSAHKTANKSRNKAGISFRKAVTYCRSEIYKAVDPLGSLQKLYETGPSETSVTTYRIKMRHNKDNIKSERVTQAASDLVN
jgi:hypothetical protein